MRVFFILFNFKSPTSISREVSDLMGETHEKLKAPTDATDF